MVALALIGQAIVFSLVLLGCAALFAWQYARQGSAGEASPALFRWGLTVGLVALFVWAFRGAGPTPGAAAQFGLIVAGMVVSVLLCILWLPSLVASVLGPLTGSLTGGTDRVELRPAYFRAVGHRKRGEYPEAIHAVRAELERFPGDAEGLLLLVDIHELDLKDPMAGLEVLQELLTTPGRSASDRALALSRKADLQLKGLNDGEGARATLELLAAEFPDSPAGHLATQRLAHLPGGSAAGMKAEPVRIAVPHHEERLGLTEDLGASRLPVENATKTARELVDHLSRHPEDWEAREQLAKTYIEPLGHLKLATDELEQLLALDGVPPRHVVRWFNELADVHLKTLDGVPAARAVLERLIARFPDSAWAAQAEARIRHLGIDQKAREGTRTLKLGHYEQRLGLKRADPSIPDPSRTGESGPDTGD
ncbi:MAG: tetratricopeptide repeat protein [Verrucomicrobiales bacterium]|nr:tetratricopeptide repeat protein [Verrucomicrobiales bacterium]